MDQIDHLPTLILVVLPRLLSPITLTGRRWRKWAISHLALRTPTGAVTLSRTTFLAVVPWLATGTAGHPRLIVGVLASTCVVVVVEVPRRPLVRALKVEVFSLIPLHLVPVLLIVIVVLLLHCHFHVHRGII